MTDVLQKIRTEHGEARLAAFSGGGVWVWHSDQHAGLPLVEVSMGPAGDGRFVVAARVAGREVSSEVYPVEGAAFTWWARRVESWDLAVKGMLIMRETAPYLGEQPVTKTGASSCWKLDLGNSWYRAVYAAHTIASRASRRNRPPAAPTWRCPNLPTHRRKYEYRTAD